MSSSIERLIKNGKTILPQTVASAVTMTDNTTVQNKLTTVESIAKGAQRAITAYNYQTLVTSLNTLSKQAFNIGQSIYIATVDVPDLWIYSNNESTSVPYTWTSDDALKAALLVGPVQMGYYKVAMLETAKVDLTNYVQKTDYATSSNAGVVKIVGGSGLFMDGTNLERLYIMSASTNEIDNKTNNYLPIVPSNLDYAIKKGLTSNSQITTDADKASCRATIGAAAETSLPQIINTL